MSEYTEGKLIAKSRKNDPFLRIYAVQKDKRLQRIVTIDDFNGGASHEGSEAEANATELVKRWNCHKDLVKIAQAIIDLDAEGILYQDSGLVRQAKAALAAAKA